MTTENEPLWRLVPLNEYVRPMPPTPEKVRIGIRDLWRRIREGGTSPDESSPKPEAELQHVPERLLDQAAPAPRWDGVPPGGEAPSLQGLADRDGEDVSCVVVVCGPYSGAREIVEREARARGCTAIAVPAPEEILEGRDLLEGTGDTRGGAVRPDRPRALLPAPPPGAHHGAPFPGPDPGQEPLLSGHL